ncbi:hypothetical protein [Nesterenkonia sandarakina]|uniref:Uncharacterized protein n=1 Tax=Nesterenkonia sandarakina TaxID=272918 RepID=A0A2T0YMW4_9MICC|nr:hypothetical protein [Nesterenkonia sandarakina]PRZ16691.1 hypothetical protein BCL67_10611 [Nesterenkonia sandarakina]
MDITLIQTFNAFFMAAVLLAVPVLLIAGIWGALGRRQPIPVTVELQPVRQPANQS